MTPKTVIVIPSNREANLLSWLDRWKREFAGHPIILVEDNLVKTFRVPDRFNINHCSWEDVDKELNNNSWIIPRNAAAIRSFGFLKAYQLKPDMIITLDDDCYPDDENFVQRHWEALNTPKLLGWVQHFQGIRARGLPYDLGTCQTVLNMGLWSNIPDLDGKTQVAKPEYRSKSTEFNFHAPFGYFMPLSSMNLAFRPEIVPAYYFLLMGKEYGHY